MKLKSKIKEFMSEELLKQLAAVCDTRRIDSAHKKMKLIQQLLKKNGIVFQPLGGATNRIALMIDGYTFKFALDRQGYKDNLMEYALSPELQPYVTKTYETNGYVVIAECVRVMTLEEWNLRKQDILKILEILGQDYLLGDVGFLRKNFTNWGIRSDGSLVILDYAYCHRATENLFACEVCGAGILRYSSDFSYLKCSNSIVCNAKHEYIDRKLVQGDTVDWDMIKEMKDYSIVISKGKTEAEVTNNDGHLTDDKIRVINNLEDYYEYLKRRQKMGVRFDENELFDLTTRLMQASSQEERDMIRQELVNAVIFIQDEEDAENGIEYKIDFDMINADMRMNCDDDDDDDDCMVNYHTGYTDSDIVNCSYGYWRNRNIYNSDDYDRYDEDYDNDYDEDGYDEDYDNDYDEDDYDEDYDCDRYDDDYANCDNYTNFDDLYNNPYFKANHRAVVQRINGCNNSNNLNTCDTFDGYDDCGNNDYYSNDYYSNNYGYQDTYDHDFENPKNRNNDRKKPKKDTTGMICPMLTEDDSFDIASGVKTIEDCFMTPEEYCRVYGRDEYFEMWLEEHEEFHDKFRNADCDYGYNDEESNENEMTLEEAIDWAKEILSDSGYTVIKDEDVKANSIDVVKRSGLLVMTEDELSDTIDRHVEAALKDNAKSVAKECVVNEVEKTPIVIKPVYIGEVVEEDRIDTIEVEVVDEVSAKIEPVYVGAIDTDPTDAEDIDDNDVKSFSVTIPVTRSIDAIVEVPSHKPYPMSPNNVIDRSYVKTSIAEVVEPDIVEDMYRTDQHGIIINTQKIQGV